MQNTFTISAVIPSYNRENTIKRCIDSILNQSYPVFEIIVVDDGSTDQTLNIIKTEYGDVVRIIRQNHKGAQAARNVGIRAAKGQYIAFLDSDDEWLPNKLELQVRELHKDKDVVICGDGYIQRDWNENVPIVYRKNINDDKGVKKGSKKILRMNGKSGTVYRAILRESFCLFSLLLTSKESLLEIGLLDENVPSFQEWDTAIQLAKVRRFSYIQKPMFIYHLHDGETISKSTRKEIDGLEYICQKYKYEILNQLGNQGMVEKYRELMRKCVTYKDKRLIKYFIFYILGRINVFVLK